MGILICCTSLRSSNLISKKLPVTDLVSDNDIIKGNLIQIKIPSDKIIKDEFYSGFQSGIIFNDESVIAISIIHYKTFDSKNKFSIGKDELKQIIEYTEPEISGFKSKSEFYYYLNDSIKLNGDKYFGIKNYSNIIVSYLNVNKVDVKMFNEIIKNVKID